MKNRLVLSVIVSVFLFVGCGDVEINIVELDFIEVLEDDYDYDYDGDYGLDYEIESEGRLVVVDVVLNMFIVFDLDDNLVFDMFFVIFDGSSVSVFVDYCFVVINSWVNGLIEFFDGGLWWEDYVEYLYDYEEVLSLFGFIFEGS